MLKCHESHDIQRVLNLDHYIKRENGGITLTSACSRWSSATTTLAIPILLWCLLGSLAPSLADSPQDRRVPGAITRFYPLSFNAEVVRLLVEADSVRVEGLYQLTCHQPGPEPVSLLYPYPADSLMGEAHTAVLECRVADGAWQPLPIEEVPHIPAARWRVPRDLGETLEVRTVYHQALNGNHARYIVTTTSAWGRPLRTARFEISLPPGSQPTFFSYPFTRMGEDQENWYVYEAEDFLPEQDIVVEWEP